MDKLGSRAIIGIGVKFSGKITGARAIEINGDVIADLRADKVTIGVSGVFEGAISADLVVVSGEYDGVMNAGSVWATKTARISGSVQYKTLQMDRGAAMNCHVVHNWTSEPKTKNVDAKQDHSSSELPDTTESKEKGQDAFDKTSGKSGKLPHEKKKV